MGCDYYKYLYLVIQYVTTDDKNEEEIIELSRSNGYLFGNEWDDSFETRYDYLERLNNEISVPVDLYSNDKWLCLDFKADEYQIYVSRISNLKKLKRIYKVYNIMDR